MLLKNRTDSGDKGAVFHPGDLLRMGLAAAAFFMILCSYYILRPVRDEMAVQFGSDRVHWLFTGTFVLALLVVPLFGWVVRRMPRSRVLGTTYGFLILNLLGFCLLFAVQIPSPVSAAIFFMWVSVFNLFVVSLFWSDASDCFSNVESRRLYGYIAGGGTAGALAGPLITALLAKHVSTSVLLSLSALLLTGAAMCMIVLRSQRPDDAHGHARPIGGSIVAGIPLTLGVSKLRGIALLVICYTTVSTALYVEVIDLAGRSFSNSGERKGFFATVDLVVNSLSLLVQVLGTRAIVQRYGLRLALPAVPLLIVTGLGALAVWGTLIGFVIVQVMHRVAEYAVGKPAREMIYTTVDAESRYKAKNFIDLALYRANDAASAWIIALIRGMGLSAIVFVGIPAALAWIFVAASVGRQHDRHDHHDHQDHRDQSDRRTQNEST